MTTESDGTCSGNCPAYIVNKNVPEMWESKSTAIVEREVGMFAMQAIYHCTVVIGNSIILIGNSRKSSKYFD